MLAAGAIITEKENVVTARIEHREADAPLFGFAVLFEAILLVGLLTPLSSTAQETTPQTEQAPLIPIGQAITDRDGDTIPDLLGRTVHVRGVVTIPTGIISDAYLQAFIQDDTGAIFLFDRKIEQDLQLGDLVDAVGQIDQYRGAIQLINPRYEVIGRKELPAATNLSIRAAGSWANYGRLVQVKGVLGKSESQTIILIPLRAGADDPSAKIDVFIPRKVERAMLDDDFPPGATVSVVGIVSIRAFDRPYLDGFQVILRDSEDFRVLSKPTPLWVRELALGAALVALLVIIVFLTTRTRVAKRERQLSLVNELSMLIASPHLDRDQLLDQSVKMLRERAAAKAVAIQLVGDDGRLRLERSDGMRTEDANVLRDETFPTDQSASARTDALETLEKRGYHVLARLPISGRARSIGVLTVFSSRRITGPETLAIISAATGIIGIGLENTAMMRESEEREAELKQLAITDDLTGLYNRRFLEEYLRIQFAMAHRQREPIAFITIDLDHFKKVNDTWGHETGDRVLARTGELIHIAARSSDLPVRLGGEEFLIVMPQTDAAGARIFAERLLETIAEADFTHIDRHGQLRITASAGVSAFPEHGDNVRVLLRKADEGLYEAKSAGRKVVRVPG